MVIIVIVAMITFATLIYKCHQSSQSIKGKQKELDDQQRAFFEEIRTLEKALEKLENLYDKKDQDFSYKYAPLKERIERFSEWGSRYAQREYALWKNEQIFKQRINKKAELYRNLDSIKEKGLDFVCVYDSLDKQEQDAIKRLSKLRDREEHIIQEAKEKADALTQAAELALSEAREKEYMATYKAECQAASIISTAKTRAYNFNKKYKEKRDELLNLQSSIFALPYMAGIRADFETHGIELLANSLDWGRSAKRAEKVASIRQIRSEAKAIAERHIQAKYQLEYLLAMFPALEEVLDTEYGELPSLELSHFSDYDRTKDWLSDEEYKNLNTVEKNQLALDRYQTSKRKTKWQIGRDYELFVGYELSQKGYSVDYFGSYMGLEDLGRDLIAKKNKRTTIVQCKYWSAQKQIHEKHVLQLYGTLVSYCIEHNNNLKDTVGVLVTNITLSDTAKRMAHYLGIECIENHPMGEYPCIKCNIGKGENGENSFIYHLPFDQQYDHTKIEAPGEFFALTVAEAEAAGFRRALKWSSKGN